MLAVSLETVETEKTNTEHTQTSMPMWDSNPRSQCWSGRKHIDFIKLKLDSVKYWTFMDTNELSRFYKEREYVGQLHREDPTGHPTHTEITGKSNSWSKITQWLLTTGVDCMITTQEVPDSSLGPELNCSGGFQWLPTNFSKILAEEKLQCFGETGTSSIHSLPVSLVAVNNHWLFCIANPLHAGFLLGWFSTLNIEIMSSRKVSSYTYYTELYPRR
jgi:hypothetical protein